MIVGKNGMKSKIDFLYSTEQFFLSVSQHRDNKTFHYYQHISDVPYPEETTGVESFIFTSCGNNVGKMPPTIEDCVTYYESLGIC